MGYADLKTAESLVCGYLAGDEAYIEAHKGDVHTRMTRLLWPEELPWTGDDKKDKALAKSLCPEWDNVDGHDYRFQAKRIVHGSTYGQSPYGIARLMHIPVQVASKAQGAFFSAFPRLREWQKYIYARVVEGLPIITPFSREVTLLGRPWDEHTYKQGLALTPQSTVGDVLNTALFRVYSRHDPDLIELLAQIHDAILCQWEKALEDKALAAVKECMTVKTPITDIYGTTRTCTIGVEIAVGNNWGKVSKANPGGLEEVA
jgi:DNA polymerase I-like protein with 3'-5' exonuclease and polymerase domains